MKYLALRLFCISITVLSGCSSTPPRQMPASIDESTVSTYKYHQDTYQVYKDKYNTKTQIYPYQADSPITAAPVIGHINTQSNSASATATWSAILQPRPKIDKNDTQFGIHSTTSVTGHVAIETKPPVLTYGYNAPTRSRTPAAEIRRADSVYDQDTAAPTRQHTAAAAIRRADSIYDQDTAAPTRRHPAAKAIRRADSMYDQDTAAPTRQHTAAAAIRRADSIYDQDTAAPTRRHPAAEAIRRADSMYDQDTAAPTRQHTAAAAIRRADSMYDQDTAVPTWRHPAAEAIHRADSIYNQDTAMPTRRHTAAEEIRRADEFMYDQDATSPHRVVAKRKQATFTDNQKTIPIKQQAAAAKHAQPRDARDTLTTLQRTAMEHIHATSINRQNALSTANKLPETDTILAFLNNPPAAIAPEYNRSTPVKSLLKQAESQRAAGNLVMAAATLERSLRIDPRNPYCWNRLARIRLEQGLFSQASNMAAKSNTMAGTIPSLFKENQHIITEANKRSGH